MPFDESKVPDGPAGDWFYSGKDGRPLTDEEYDITKQRFVDAGAPLPWENKEGNNG